MIKKFGILFLAAILAFSMIACDSETKAPSTPDTNTPITPEPDTPTQEEIDAENKTVSETLMTTLLSGMSEAIPEDAEDRNYVGILIGDISNPIKVPSVESSYLMGIGANAEYSKDNATISSNTVAGLNYTAASVEGELDKTEIGIFTDITVDGKDYTINGNAICNTSGGMIGLYQITVESVIENNLKITHKDTNVTYNVEATVVKAMLEAVKLGA